MIFNKQQQPQINNSTLIYTMRNPSKATIVFSILLLLSVKVAAQYQFQIFSGTSVTVEGEQLAMPWAGGLNGAQYNQMDLNNDGFEDIIVFDRSMQLIKCFLYNDGLYNYTPAFNDFFPKGIFNFLILVDFNSDGKKDLFTAGNLGMIAYENVGVSNIPKWEKTSDFLLYESQSGNEVNLQLAFNDYPHISDIDKDGDIDVLNFNTNGLASNIIFYQNQSVELGLPLNMKNLKEVNRAWGNFEECNCGSFAFGTDDCDNNKQARGALHAGGKSVFVTDFNDDNILDLITSHQECAELYSYSGASAGINPIYTSVSSNFPNSTNPAAFNYYPNLMPLINPADNTTDLLVSPNLEAQLSIGVNYKSSNWYYREQADGSFKLATKAFLQQEMIDLGIQASPAFFDVDADGDLDMFVAYSNGQDDLSVNSGIAFYENTGTASTPSFELRDDNYLDFVSSVFYNLLIQFTDLNNDGLMDLAFQATKENGQNNLYLVFATSGGLDINNALAIDDIFIGFGYSFHLADVTGSSEYDLLVGKSSGGLILYENTGAGTAPVFTKLDNNYLSIQDSFDRSGLKITTADIDNDSKQDLLLTDQSGVIKVYSDFRSGSALFDTLFIYNEQLESFSTTNLGARNTITAAPLFNENFGTIILGTISGGLTLLRNTEEFPLRSPTGSAKLQIFPNPNNGKSLNIRLSEPAKVSITTLSGKVVIKDLNLSGGVNIVPIQTLENGLYIISAKFGKKNVESKKLVVDR